MKKEFRLLRPQDFKVAMDNRVYKKNDALSLFVYKTNVGHMRVGISTSTRIGNAVVRNKARRIVRALVDEIFDYNVSCDYVIVVKKDFLKNDYQANLKLLQDMYELIKEK